mmetsp:Transcript_31925/g.81189  ORF Transcript_31925/g.81189 Transcript_31925/m.81189 type:complete len:406 (+) Transcript_31925:1204-2421(+)
MTQAAANHLHRQASTPPKAHMSRLAGASSPARSAARNAAAASPSTARASADSVAVMRVTGDGLPPTSAVPAWKPPTARMAACGGLMMAEKEDRPYMPRLEMVKEPPLYSSGFSLPSRARAASARTSAEICDTLLADALRTMGVMRPPGVDTATATSTAGKGTGAPALSSQCTFTSGTCTRAAATALTTKSLTDSATPCAARLLRSAVSASTRASPATYSAGLPALDAVSRDAMTLRICVLGVSVKAGRPPAAALGEAAGACGGAAAAALGLGGGGGAGAAAVGAAAAGLAAGLAPAAMAASTSPLVMMLLGPVGVTCEGDRPDSSSSMRTAGPRRWLAGPADGAGAAGCAAGAGAAAFWAGAAPAPFPGTQSLNAGMLASSSTSTQTGWPMGMSLAPSCTSSLAT